MLICPTNSSCQTVGTLFSPRDGPYLSTHRSPAPSNGPLRLIIILRSYRAPVADKNTRGKQQLAIWVRDKDKCVSGFTIAFTPFHPI